MVVGGRELIDTLWNVNEPEPVYNFNQPYGINRYIMECKFYSSLKRHSAQIRINRYIMECKYICKSN